MECLVCGERCEVGSLCKACAREVAPPDSLIPEHIRDNVESIDADAWLVDGFGQAHPVVARTVVGRGDESQLMVLAKSMSREHAELSCKAGQWVIRDTSTNGTSVNGARVQGRANLPNRSVVRLGDVPMWFLCEVVVKPRPLSPDTIQVSDVRVYDVVPKHGPELQLVGDRSGGTIRSRQGSGWGPERPLTLLQSQMMRLLCSCAVAEAHLPTEIRGCVPTSRFVAELSWSSEYADDNNVRRQVLGLRAALAELGVQKLVENQPVRGYYLAGKVSPRTETT